MHEVSEARTKAGQPVQQYFGKWPFWRVFGVQEPASVLFSLANLREHMRGLRRLHAMQTPSWAQPWFLLVGYVSANGWVWSCVFHARDKPLTEVFDYHTATAIQMTTLITTCVRIGRLQGAWATSMAALIVSLFCYHVLYLSTMEHFDYGYNMKVNLCTGALTIVLWVGWLVYPWVEATAAARCRHAGRSRRGSHDATVDAGGRAGVRAGAGRAWVVPRVGARALSQFLGGLVLAVLLEVFDFAPVWHTFDAHSLWHASTAAIMHLWYDFAVLDLTNEGRLEREHAEHGEGNVRRTRSEPMTQTCGRQQRSYTR